MPVRYASDRLSMLRTLIPLTDPSAMAKLQMFCGCRLPAVNTDRPRPAGVVLQFWPGWLGALPFGGMAKADHQMPPAQALCVQWGWLKNWSPPMECNPPALSANMIVLLLPSGIMPTSSFDL